MKTSSFARQCAMPIETIRVLYLDAITRLAEQLRPELETDRLDEIKIEDRVLEFFGVDGPDEHTAAALIALASPLAPRLERQAADLVSLAVTAAAQDVIAQSRGGSGRNP